MFVDRKADGEDRQPVENRGSLQRLVGENIRAIRTERGLSQERLGERLGVHRNYVGMLERGERNLSLQTVEKFAELLEVEPLALLGRDRA